MAPSVDPSYITFDDDDHSTAMLTPTTTIADPQELYEEPAPPKAKATIPCDGKTFTIRHTKTGGLLSLFHGKICLVSDNTLGSAMHWSCHEKDGWLGFKNLASGQFLGHDEKGHLRTMPHHQAWEYFCPRVIYKGEYVLLMQTDGGNKLSPVKVCQGGERLMKINAPVSQGSRWEFIAA